MLSRSLICIIAVAWFCFPGNLLSFQLPTPRVTGDSDLATLRAQTGFAATYIRQGRYAQARPALASAVSLLEKDRPLLDKVTITSALTDFAVLYQYLGKTTQPEGFYRDALDLQKKALGPDDPAVALTMINLGECLREQGKYSSAEAFLHSAVVIARAAGARKDIWASGRRISSAGCITIVPAIRRLSSIINSLTRSSTNSLEAIARIFPLLRRIYRSRSCSSGARVKLSRSRDMLPRR